METILIFDELRERHYRRNGFMAVKVIYIYLAFFWYRYQYPIIADKRAFFINSKQILRISKDKRKTQQCLPGHGCGYRRETKLFLARIMGPSCLLNLKIII